MRNRFGVVVGVLAILLGSPRFFCCSRLVGAAAPSFGSSVGGVASRGFVLVGCLRLARVLFALVGLLCLFLLLLLLLRLASRLSLCLVRLLPLTWLCASRVLSRLWLLWLLSSLLSPLLLFRLVVLALCLPLPLCLLLPVLWSLLAGVLAVVPSLFLFGVVGLSLVLCLALVGKLLVLLLRLLSVLPVLGVGWSLSLVRPVVLAVWLLATSVALLRSKCGSFLKGPLFWVLRKGSSGPFLHTSLPPVVCRIAVGACFNWPLCRECCYVLF